MFVQTERSSGNPQMSARAFEDRGRVLLYHYEMYNENIRDLMTSRGGVTSNMQTNISTHIKIGSINQLLFTF